MGSDRLTIVYRVISRVVDHSLRSLNSHRALARDLFRKLQTPIQRGLLVLEDTRHETHRYRLLGAEVPRRQADVLDPGHRYLRVW